MSKFEKIMTTFFTFFALLTILAIGIEYRVYLSVKDQFRLEDRRKELGKEISYEKLDAVWKLSSEYNAILDLNRIKRKYLVMQYMWDTEKNINIKDFQSEINKLYEDIFFEQNECFKKVKTILTLKQIELYVNYDKICHL